MILPAVDADLYVLHHLECPDALDRFELNADDAVPRGFVARHSEVQRIPQADVTGMADWTHQMIDIAPEAVAARPNRRRITRAGVTQLPDTIGWAPLRIVSTAFKAFLEGAFPDGGRFYPYRFRDAQTSEDFDGGYWHWLPRHYLRFNPASPRSADHAKRPQTWGTLGHQDATWEMTHNAAFHAHVASLPYWTASPRFQEVVFRGDVYQRIRQAGFTGFNEADANNYLRQNPEDTVGYVSFAQAAPRGLWGRLFSKT